MTDRVLFSPGVFVAAACSAALVIRVPSAHAQGPAQGPEGEPQAVKHVMVRVGEGPEAGGGAVRSFAWTEAQETVTEAPYSADAVTEVTQTLADGNRINRRTVSRIYRDAAGRVRREQSISGVGPIAAAAEGARIVFINDPVSKTMYTLNPERQEARKLPVNVHVRTAKIEADATHEHEAVDVQKVERRVVVVQDGKVMENVAEGSGAPMAKHLAIVAGGNEDAVEVPHGPGEPLGSRTIEGVEAEGTRWTKVIKAGAVGNERPIEVVTERWYSPALKAVVLAKHSDPRLGETVYQLTNIVRQEPPADLFVVPSDYKVVEGGNLRFTLPDKVRQQ